MPICTPCHRTGAGKVNLKDHDLLMIRQHHSSDRLYSESDHASFMAKANAYRDDDHPV